jgi:hypothetical protein
MASEAKGKSTLDLSDAIAVVAVAAGLNYALVQYGTRPWVYCLGREVAEFTGITAWYGAITFMTALLALGVACTKGFTHSIKFLVLLAFLCVLPEWLDRGFRLGGTCQQVTEPPTPAKAPPAVERVP